MMTDNEALDLKIKVARSTLDRLLAERKTRRDRVIAEAIAAAPWKPGDRVTTAQSYQNYRVDHVTPKAVVVESRWGTERIPFARVLPADPEKDKRARTSGGTPPITSEFPTCTT